MATEENPEKAKKPAKKVAKSAKKTPSKSTPSKKTPAKKVASKAKSPAKKAPAKKVAAKKTSARKAPAKQTVAKKIPAPVNKQAAAQTLPASEEARLQTDVAITLMPEPKKPKPTALKKLLSVFKRRN